MARLPQVNVAVGKPSTYRTDFTDKRNGLTFLYKVRVLDIPQMGNMQIPIAGTARVCKIVKLHAPCMKRHYIWEVRRIGDFPDNLPDMDTGDANEVYNGGWLANDTPLLMPNGKSKVYSLSGVYVYLLKKFDDTQPIAKVPTLRMSKLKILPSDFSGSLK
jgi:hypothetical protein